MRCDECGGTVVWKDVWHMPDSVHVVVETFVLCVDCGDLVATEEVTIEQEAPCTPLS